jgi:hypothetical protein
MTSCTANEFALSETIGYGRNGQCASDLNAATDWLLPAYARSHVVVRGDSVSPCTKIATVEPIAEIGSQNGGIIIRYGQP